MDAIIRISPAFSKNTPPQWFDNKLQMIEVCLKSLEGAGKCNKTLLLDNCPKEYATKLKQYGEVYEGNWGKKVSLYTAYDYARQNCKEDILFLEDDYLWRPNTLQAFSIALHKFELISPYDHPGHYVPGRAHEGIPVAECTWRWCHNSTHTFAVTNNVFMSHLEDFYYGLHDWQMFFKLEEHGQRVYCPMYSMATHLVDGLMAYNVDWYGIAGYYKKQL